MKTLKVMNGCILIEVTDDDLNKDGSFDVPSYVTAIDNGAFKGCKNLTKLNLPKELTSIGDWASFASGVKTAFIDSTESRERHRVTSQNKVVRYSESELHELWEKELGRIINAPTTNSLFRLAENIREQYKVPALSPELFSLINEHMGDHNPYYFKAKVLIQRIPLPKKGESRGSYEAKIRLIVNDCIKKADDLNEEPIPSNKSSLLTALFSTATAVGTFFYRNKPKENPAATVQISNPQFY